MTDLDPQELADREEALALAEFSPDRPGPLVSQAEVRVRLGLSRE